MNCKICNKEIPNDSVFCSFCGNKIEKINDDIIKGAENESAEYRENTNEKTIDATEIPQNIEIKSIETEKPIEKKLKYIGFAILSTVVLPIVVLIGLYFFNNRIITQDINVINGCPEIYNLEFGTEVKDVSDVLEFKHTKYIAGINQESWLEPITDDSCIATTDDIDYKIYGVPIESIIFDFNRYNLDGVIIFISKDDITLDKLSKLYTKIYGEPTQKKNSDFYWRGPNTEIVVGNDKTDEKDDTLMVYYRAANLNFKKFDFTGPEFDPLWIRIDALGEHIGLIIDVLNEGKDYSVEVFNPEGFEGFTKYTLYPDFEYMGLEEGATAIQFDVAEDESKISVASYAFFLGKDNVLGITRYIKSKLEEKYGKQKSCTYGSTYYDELGEKNITFSEMLTKINKQEQGMYFVRWEASDGLLITLSLYKNTDVEKYEGKVSFSYGD